jgi:hypothetical protein
LWVKVNLKIVKSFIFAQNSELAKGAVSKILPGAEKFQKNC